MSNKHVHDAMVASCARWRASKREIVARDVSIGPWSSGGIADVAVVRPKWRGKTVCFEVKVSRADFLSDIRTEKWRKYASVFDLLYFAVPAGLVDRREVPKGVGLVVHDGGDWEVAKQANSRSYPDTDRAEVLMSVLLNKHPASWKREPSC